MRKIILGGLVGAALALGACGGGGSDGAVDPAAADLLGKWIIEKTAIKGTYKVKDSTGADSTRDIDTAFAGAGESYYVDLKADNRFTAIMPPLEIYLFLLIGPGGFGGIGGEKVAAPRALEGTWTLSGKTITAITESDTLTLQADVEGAKGSFSQQVDERTPRFEAVGTVTYSGTRK